MRTLSHLFKSNRAWAETIKTEDPEFADPRGPANQIIVHRNAVKAQALRDLDPILKAKIAAGVAGAGFELYTRAVEFRQGAQAR